MISEQALLIVKATAPVVKENAEAITSTFYPKMLGRHPELFDYFNESNQKSGIQAKSFGQVLTGGGDGGPCLGARLAAANKGPNSSPGQQTKTLADAIVAYALNIDKLELLSETVARMCHKHAALNVKPAHYQIVHDNLMESIGEVLGAAVTPEVAAAWSEAVMALAKICIKTEERLYEQAAETQWTGTREMIISEIIPEAKDIVSIRLTPKDGKGTCPFKAGQYLTIYEKPEDKQYFAPRHYTITSQPGDSFYQVTIKKLKAADHTGIMSHYLHNMSVGDSIMAGAAYGPSSLQKGGSEETVKDRTAVFVSAGVGITPTVARIPTALNLYKNVVVFHADSSPETMAFHKYLQDLASDTKISLDLSFSGHHETTCVPFESKGRLSAEKIVNKLQASSIGGDELVLAENVEVFVCAGATNTPSFCKGLVSAGVPSNRVHLEYFGPFVTVELDE